MKSGKRVLIMTAVPVEQDAVLRGLRGAEGFHVAAGGVGPAAAAASTASALAADEYDLVISAGIGGGFSGYAVVGSLVVASEIIAADLGVETTEGFCSVDELGFGSARVEVDACLGKRIMDELQRAGLQANFGPILTVSTVTGTAESASALANRIPRAAAEAMEGYGVAIAAKLRAIPVIELRAISNPVGPRDRSAWRIKEALEALEAASSVLSSVLAEVLR